MSETVLEQLLQPQVIREEIAVVTLRREVLKRLLRVAEYAATRRQRLEQPTQSEDRTDG